MGAAPEGTARAASIGAARSVADTGRLGDTGFLGDARRVGEVARVAAVGPALTPLGATRFCLAYPDQCRIAPPFFRPKRMAATQRQLRELDEVNRAVNRAIRPRPDPPGLLNDVWTIAPAAGDCDKYAVTKRAELIKRGWSQRSLLLSQVLVPSGEGHLVLVARTHLGDFVLDNLVGAVLPAARVRHRWVSIQSPADPRVWRTAALEPRTIVAAADAPEYGAGYGAEYGAARGSGREAWNAPGRRGR